MISLGNLAFAWEGIWILVFSWSVAVGSVDLKFLSPPSVCGGERGANLTYYFFNSLETIILTFIYNDITK